MVNLYTPQPTQTAPPPVSTNFSPEVLAALERLIQLNPQQDRSQIPSLPLGQTSQSTTAYGTSNAAMTSIDPALLMAQWRALQPQNLPTQAVATPQIQQPIYQPNYQQAGETLTPLQAQSIAEYIQASHIAAEAAEKYVRCLETLVNYAVTEYFQLLDFSEQQNRLINHFLYDREFVLKYIRGAWHQQPISEQLANDIATVFLELHEVFPHKNAPKNPEFAGNKNVRFDAQVVPNNPVVPTQIPSQIPAQNLIPPLPNSNATGQQQGGITIDQYYAAIQAGQALEARRAALQSPAALYAALLS